MRRLVCLFAAFLAACCPASLGLAVGSSALDERSVMIKCRVAFYPVTGYDCPETPNAQESE